MIRRIGALLLVVTFGLHAVAARPASADAKRRSVAVLEFRGGSEAASEIGARLARILAKSTSLQVVSPDDARRRSGLDLDEQVAGCAGEAACVARLGRQIGVDDVLLVGVSEFGDLILALQVVSSRSGAVTSRFAESLPRGHEPDDESLDRYLRRLLPPVVFKRYGTLTIRTNVSGALVIVDGEKVGVTPVEPIVVSAPATVELKLSKNGYEDFTARIDVPPESAIEVRPDLSPKGAAEPWYGKWWVWAIVGGVVTTGIVSGLLILAPGETDVPVTGQPCTGCAFSVRF